MDDDEDFALALKLDQEWNNESSKRGNSLSVKSKSLSIVDPTWELIDPLPDIRDLFVQFNSAYFYGLLESVEVKWSSRMTLCAGLCCYEGRGGLCCIKLSQPLLKLRPRKDFVETLLHEMIHALLFVTDNNKDHDGHGPEFHKHMHRINAATGASISVYHSFHDEVNEYRQHWWRCGGLCVKQPPFYGIVRRSMNRAPSPKDRWWTDHQRRCGGVFTKIKEPENYGKKKKNQIEPLGNAKKNNNTDNIEKGQFINEKNRKLISDYFIGQGDHKSNNYKKTHFKTMATPNADVNNFNISKFDTSIDQPNIGVSASIGEPSTSLGQSNTGFRKHHTGGNIKLGVPSISSSTITVKNNSSNTISENPICQTSSENSSSNIYGFKMSANKKPQNKQVSLFSGNGFAVGSCNESSIFTPNERSAREEFLKRLDTTRKHYTQETKKKQQKEREKESSHNDIHSPRKKIKIEQSLIIDCPHSTSTNRRMDDVICIEDSISIVECPACPAKLPQYELNKHLDVCLS